MLANKQSLTEIMNDPHFNQLAALLSIGMSAKFVMSHPEVPNVRATLEYRLSRLVRGYQKDATFIKNDIIKEFSHLIQQIADADKSYFYRPEDYEWFVSVMEDNTTAQITLSSLFAVAVSRRTFYSLEQVAAMPDRHGEMRAAETLRQRAQRGEIIGAFKVGKTWMVPDLSLRAIGIKMA
jgi:hypothetical protein